MTEKAKKARAAYKREWTRKNAEHVRAYYRAWYAANPEKVKAYRDRYWEKRADKDIQQLESIAKGN